MSFFQSQISKDDLLFSVSFATFREKETNEIEIEDWDCMTLQMQ